MDAIDDDDHHNTVAAAEPAQIDRMDQLGSRLQRVQHSIEHKLNLLETQLGEPLEGKLADGQLEGSFDQRMDAFEARVEQRLDAIEGMLRDLMSKLPPKD